MTNIDPNRCAECGQPIQPGTEDYSLEWAPDTQFCSAHCWEKHMVKLAVEAEEIDVALCQLCGRPAGANAHLHGDGLICERCWDDRLHASE